MSAIETFVGFDSAWTDNPKAPGAICAVQMRPDAATLFHEPRLSSFDDAVAFVEAVSAGSGYTLIGLDQPTIVPNVSSMRPAERVAASVVSWVGGGVQPANRGKIGMFCDASPIWPFLSALNAYQDPMSARGARTGRHLMEVFPALALASLEPQFGQRLGAPKYNPAKARQFSFDHWKRVCDTAARSFERWGMAAPAAWCRAAAALPTPIKADQDRLDAMLCLAIALHWRLAPPEQSIMIGDLERGYIVTPASAEMRMRLTQAARKSYVSIDGLVPA